MTDYSHINEERKSSTIWLLCGLAYFLIMMKLNRSSPTFKINCVCVFCVYYSMFANDQFGHWRACSIQTRWALQSIFRLQQPWARTYSRLNWWIKVNLYHFTLWNLTWLLSHHLSRIAGAKRLSLTSLLRPVMYTAFAAEEQMMVLIWRFQNCPLHLKSW